MIKTVQFESASLGRTVPITIIEPTRLTIEGRCHTLFALHGLGGSHVDWVENARLDDYVADLPAVTILPSGGDNFYMDHEGGAYESLVAKDLVAYADSHYPTIQSPKSRATVGLSMGGWGALILALRNPDVFGAAASHSGAVIFNAMEAWEPTERIFGTGEQAAALRESHDIATLAKSFLQPIAGRDKLRYTGPALYFDCGADDFLWANNRTLADSLRAAAVPYEYHEYPGAHEWVYWDRHVRDGVKFIQRELKW